MRCCVEKTVYRTQKGWSVILCKALEPVSDPEGQERKKVFCVGNGLPTIQGIEFEAVGEWRQYRGEYQYYVKGYNPLVTENELEVVRFLSRGICTIKTAKDIYRKFGQSSIEVLRSAPQRLLEIKEIGRASCRERVF